MHSESKKDDESESVVGARKRKASVTNEDRDVSKKLRTESGDEIQTFEI